MLSFGVAHSSSILSTAHPVLAKFVAGEEEFISELPFPSLVSAVEGVVGTSELLPTPSDS